METSYKEKYEQALAKAKEHYNYPCTRSCMGILEEIFPELAESEGKPNGGIVREDFTQGNGWYKVNLDYLSKAQVEEIEQLVEKWNPKEVSEDEKIKKAILIYLDWLDGKKDYLPKGDYTIKDMILWLEKQGQVKESFISQHENKMCKENDDSLTSEDEKIRKWIINEIKIKHHNLDEENVDFVDKAITWLEKKSITFNNAHIIDSALNDYCCKQYDALHKENGGVLSFARLQHLAMDIYGWCKEYLQCEQKFEMKSAEESLGIDSDTYNKIVDECIFDEQKSEENKGNIGVISANPKWSEENEPQKELVESYLAKFDEKFPILPTLKGKRLADYKNFLNRCQQIFRLKYWGIRPTQAKLFEKLSLLWAAWGAEHLQGLGQTDGDMDDEILWSEEDEHRIKDTVYFLDTAKKHYASTEELDACIDWLKSLKERIGGKV